MPIFCGSTTEVHFYTRCCRSVRLCPYTGRHLIARIERWVSIEAANIGSSYVRGEMYDTLSSAPSIAP